MKTIPVPHVPKVRVPYTTDDFYTDSFSALALDATELIATIKQTPPIEIEYMTDTLLQGNL